MQYVIGQISDAINWNVLIKEFKLFQENQHHTIKNQSSFFFFFLTFFKEKVFNTFLKLLRLLHLIVIFMGGSMFSFSFYFDFWRF